MKDMFSYEQKFNDENLTLIEDSYDNDDDNAYCLTVDDYEEDILLFII